MPARAASFRRKSMTCPRKFGHAIPVSAGQTLIFDYIRRGARACIAVACGIDKPPAFESRSTCAIGASRGVGRHAIQNGNALPVGTDVRLVNEDLSAPSNLRHKPGDTAELRVFPNPYRHRITDAAGEKFFAETRRVRWKPVIWAAGSRAGRRVNSRNGNNRSAPASDPSNIMDAPYTYGSIQVPGGVEPIVTLSQAAAFSCRAP